MVLVRPTPPPVDVPSTQNRQNVVGHFGPAAVLRDSAGVMTAAQNATSGTKETAQHPRDKMGSIMHCDGLEMYGVKIDYMYPVLRL